MASAAASGNFGAFTLTSVTKGEASNLIRCKVVMPDAATGAEVVSVSGNDITVKLAADGATGVISSTKGTIYTAVAADASVTALAAVGTGSATGANTGAEFTGSAAAPFVKLAGGAEGTSTVLLDNLAAAGGDIYTGPTGASRFSVGKNTHYKQTTATGNGATAQEVDIFEVFNPADGSYHSVAAVAATGASAAVLALGRTKDKQARKGVGLGKPGV